MKNWSALEARIEPIENPYYIVEEEGNSVVKSIKKLSYKYFLCDYCGSRIIIEKDRDKRTGGLVEFTVADHKTLKLALCNCCLNAARKDINEYYNINI